MISASLEPYPQHRELNRGTDADATDYIPRIILSLKPATKVLLEVYKLQPYTTVSETLADILSLSILLRSSHLVSVEDKLSIAGRRDCSRPFQSFAD